MRKKCLTLLGKIKILTFIMASHPNIFSIFAKSFSISYVEIQKKEEKNMAFI